MRASAHLNAMIVRVRDGDRVVRRSNDAAGLGKLTGQNAELSEAALIGHFAMSCCRAKRRNTPN